MGTHWQVPDQILPAMLNYAPVRPELYHIEKHDGVELSIIKADTMGNISYAPVLPALYHI